MNTVDIFKLFVEGLSNYWWAPPIGVFFWWLNSPRVKGRVGEWSVLSKLGSGLDPSTYTVLHDVTLPTARGTTQIDQIILSPFGIFVIEVKNWSGALYGDSDQAQWTQVFGRHKKVGIQNPFRQNYAHVKAVAAVTGLNEKDLESLVILTGTATFKKERPHNLVHRRDALAYIRRFQVPKHTDTEVYAAVQAVSNARHVRSAATDRAHRDSLKQVAANQNCPKCGAQMTKRTAKKGATAGQQFLGCSSFPKCRGTRPLI